MPNQLAVTHAGDVDPNDLSQLSDDELDAQLQLAQAHDQEAASQAPAAPPMTYGQQAQHVAGLTGRAALDAVTGLPLAAMDAGVGTRNILGDIAERISIGGTPVKASTPDYELPSSMWNQGMHDLGVAEPHGLSEAIPTALTSMALSGKLPGGGAPEESATSLDPITGRPVARGGAPAGYEDPMTTVARLRAEVLRRGQAQGAKVPPATTNPTLANRTLETIAGKTSTQQHVLDANALARQRAANLTLGQHPDTPLTIASMDAIMKGAGADFEYGRTVPLWKTSQEYLEKLTQIASENQGSNESFPGSASPDVAKLVDTYLQPTMTGPSAVSAIKLLRGKADDAFRGGNSELGRVYRQLSGAIEDELARGADLRGMPATVTKLQQARTLYAKAATIRDAMLPDGTIDGTKLAQAWNHDVPMTGPLNDMAEFARQFPKANVSPTVSGSPVHHLQSLESFVPALFELHQGMESGSGLGMSLARSAVAGGLIPLARKAARARLLSERGQRNAVPESAQQQGPRYQFTPQQYAAGIQSLRETTP